jgi:CGNR zinc finger protein
VDTLTPGPSHPGAQYGAGWLLAFAALNLDEQEEHTVGLQLSAFIDPTQPPMLMDELDIAGWQRYASRVLETLKAGNPWGRAIRAKAHLQIGPDGRLTGRVETPRPDEQRAQVIADVLTAGPRFRRCPRPGCSTLFVARGRQRFCSQRCGALTRTWRHRRTLERRRGSSRVSEMGPSPSPAR